MTKEKHVDATEIALLVLLMAAIASAIGYAALNQPEPQIMAPSSTTNQSSSSYTSALMM